MIKRFLVLALGCFGVPHVAWATPVMSQTCNVVDATGVSRDVQFAFDSVSEPRQIGFSYSSSAESMPMPQKATYLAYKPHVAVFVVDTDKGKFELSIARGNEGPVEVVLAPYSGAKPEAGFVGYCFSSDTTAPALLETSVQATDQNDRPFLGWTKVETDLIRVCKFVRSDRRYVDGRLKIAAQSDDGIAFPISLEAGGVGREGKIANLAVSGEGDHRLVTGLFLAGEKNALVIGAVKSRGPVDWVYFNPGKDSTNTVRTQGICQSRSIEGQAKQ